MTAAQDPGSVLDPAAAQHTLAACLHRLGAQLQQPEAAPLSVMEAAVAALALTRTWLEADLVQAALVAAPRAQLEWWERELAEDEIYVVALHEAVRAKVHGYLLERNGHLPRPRCLDTCSSGDPFA